MSELDQLLSMLENSGTSYTRGDDEFTTDVEICQATASVLFIFNAQTGELIGIQCHENQDSFRY